MQKHKDILAMNDEEAREELRRRHATELDREDRRQRVQEIALQEGVPIELCDGTSTVKPNIVSLRGELLHDNQEYLEKIQLGKQIASIIDENEVREDSLTKIRHEALELYRSHMPRIDIHSAQLKPWQADLLKIVQQPSQREVVWVHGHFGNEGKSWFQTYLEALYGYARVVRLDLQDRTSNILFTLSKRPLQSTDIFLFNDTKTDDHISRNYAVLEHIKDGTAISSKYSSKVLRFKIPNILIVFSNSLAKTSELSEDRWRLFSINKDRLKQKKQCKTYGQSCELSNYIDFVAPDDDTVQSDC